MLHERPSLPRRNVSSSRPFPVDGFHAGRAIGIIKGQLWDTPTQAAVSVLQKELHRVYVDVCGGYVDELLDVCELDDCPPARQQEILTGMLAFQVVRTYGPRYEDHLLAGEWLTLPDSGDQVTAV